MRHRRVPNILQRRIIKWFDYVWITKRGATDEERVLTLLPLKLRSEIAIQVHLDTLKKVGIFENTEQGFLEQLVLKLKPLLFSPGDYICRKGRILALFINFLLPSLENYTSHRLILVPSHEDILHSSPL